MCKNHSEAFRNVKFNPGEKMSIYAVFTTVSRAVRQWAVFRRNVELFTISDSLSGV